MGIIRGPGPARIAWGYRTAAELVAWTITAERLDSPPGAFRRTLVAELGNTIDLHALRQTPLTFVVIREGRPSLSWPIVPSSIAIGLNALTGELGAKEESSVAIRTA